LPTIGWLGSATAITDGQRVAAFERRLRELGWIDGRNVAIEYRWAEGRNEGEQLRRHLDAEQRRGSPVNDEVEFDGLLDGQFGGLGALEDVAGIDADLARGTSARRLPDKRAPPDKPPESGRAPPASPIARGGW
jgi:hypothetical protein